MWFLSSPRLSVHALLIAASLAAFGCAAAAPTTRVERGETVTTGDAAFDAFFGEVAQVKAEADKAATEVSEAARPLVDAAGAPNKATPPPEVVRAEAKKLQTDGTLLHLDLLPEAKLVTSSRLEGQSEKLLTAAEQSAKASLAAARHGAEILARVADLERRRAELVDQAKTAFSDTKQRDSVSLELIAAASVLESARQAAEKHAGAASRLALDLAVALETGAGSSAVAKKPAKPGWKPSGTGVAAPAKPKGDDFDR